MLTWEQAEGAHPGSSVKWDVFLLTTSIGSYEVLQFFENAAGGLTLVLRTALACPVFVFHPYFEGWRRS